MDVGHLKTTSYTTPLFRTSLKMLPSLHPSAICYLFLPNASADNSLQGAQYICSMRDSSNEIGNGCIILLEGDCFDTFVKSKWNCHEQLLPQSQVWVLSQTISRAFCQLKERGCSSKLTHFKQYSIRRMKQGPAKYKLLFHSSMVSQVDAASNSTCEWSTLYLSPEELLHRTQVPQKSIVFSFGLLLLNLCSPCDRHRSCYRQDQYEVDENIISEKINLAYARYNYSRNLLTFILNCLHLDPFDRWDFDGLYTQAAKCAGARLQISGHRINMDQNTNAEEEFSPKVMFYRPRHYNIVQTPDPKMSQSRCNSETPHHLNENVSTVNHLVRSQVVGTHKKQKGELNVGSMGTQKLNFNDQSLYSDSLQSQSEERPSTPPEKSKLYEVRNLYRGTFGTDKKGQKSSIDQNKVPYQIIIQHSQIEAMRPSRGRNIQRVKTDRQQLSEGKFNQQGIKNDKEGKGQLIEKGNDQKLPQFSSPLHHYINSSALKKDEQSSKLSPGFIKQAFIVPDLLKEVSSLKIDDCMKPISDLIKHLATIHASGEMLGVWTQGDIYYGMLNENSQREGVALEIYSNDDYYYGQFKEDKYHGAGFYKWSSGQYFFGSFHVGLKTYGLLHGDVIYQGYFQNNKRHGQGICWYATGEIYTGNWQNGERHGHGVIVDPSGPQFMGIWQQGKRRGEGCLENDWIRIAGCWNGEVIEGQSFIQYSNGDVFKGRTGPNLQKIEGNSYSHSGNGFRGLYREDEPISGEFTYHNGDRYLGSLHQHMRRGYGQYRYSNGAVYKGNWDNNKKV